MDFKVMFVSTIEIIYFLNESVSLRFCQSKDENVMAIL